ncbi:Helicase associated domain protein [Kitasatospora sp. NPDC058046]|uniref:DEAD/DEAH box helicase n=1 Tax=Kitasatospora sp. NPDC058046 TaxID=3346312 RepID=UPI0036D8C45C
MTGRHLFAHQVDAVAAVRGVLSGGARRVTAVLACGGGKTRIGAEVAHQVASAGGGRKAVVVPTLELVTQTVAEWSRHLGRHGLGQVIAVCSDKEVLASTTLLSGDWTVTSSPADLARYTSAPGPVTIVCTYQSLGVVSAAQLVHDMPEVDIGVIDEAHRTAGAGGKAWAVVHDQHALRFTHRLYLTATPKIVTGGDDVVSMSDERVFGPVAYTLSFADAIRLDILAPYRVVVPVVGDDSIAQHLEAEGSVVHLGDATVQAQQAALQLAVLRAAHEFHIKRLITFHSRVAAARSFANTLARVGELLGPHERPAGLWARHVDGAQDPAVRRRVLQELGQDGDLLRVVANARVLGEGVDVPAVDAVAILHPMGPIAAVQALGRAGRRGDRRIAKVATYMIPALLKPGEDPHEALAASSFAGVWQTLQALAALDGTVADSMESARRRLGRSGGRDAGEAVPRALMPWLHVTGLPTPKLPDFARAITLQAVRMTTTSWEEYIGAAEAYRAEHTDLLVPQPHRTDSGLRLGDWISHQRAFYAAGQLSRDRIAQLDALGMIWNVPAHELEILLAQLRAHREEHGHLRIARDCVQTGPHGQPFKLGEIAKTLRGAYAKGAVPEAKVKALTAEGFVWDPAAAEWQRFLADLTAFKLANKHLDVPQRHQVDGRKVGSRVSECRNRPERLTAAEVAELDRLGFIWDALEYRWKQIIKALRRLKREHGSLQFPRGLYIEDPGFRPQAWLYQRGKEAAAGQLTPKRLQDLLDLGLEIPVQRKTRQSARGPEPVP